MCAYAASGSTEDIGALSLALQIIDASQELQETVAHLKKLMPSPSDKHAEHLQPVAQGRQQGHNSVVLSRQSSMLVVAVLFHASSMWYGQKLSQRTDATAFSVICTMEAIE